MSMIWEDYADQERRQRLWSYQHPVMLRVLWLGLLVGVAGVWWGVYRLGMFLLGL